MDNLVEDTPKQFGDIKKIVSDSHDYSFLVDLRESFYEGEGKQYRHDFLGMPNVPIVGRYGGKGYEFGTTVGLVSLDLKYDALQSKEWKAESKSYNLSHTINIPNEVEDLLINIPAKIEENKKEDLEGEGGNQGQGKKKGQQGKKKNNNNNKQQNNQNMQNENDTKSNTQQQQQQNSIIGENEESKSQPNDSNNRQQEQQQKQKQQNIMPVLPYMPTETVRFNWVIELNNMELPDKVKDQNKIFYNYVCHTLLFPVIDFSKTKRIISRTPICMVIPKGHEKDCGIGEFIESENSKSKYYSGLSLNKFRREYSSAHLGKGGYSLCFSPNNMKVVVDRQKQISYFWTVILDETLRYNQCYFHWLVNDENLFGFFQNAAKDSKNLKELFKDIEELVGKENEVAQYTRLILNLS